MKYLLSIFSVIYISTVSSQAYFQQEVNYTISVKLDDKNHSLSGFESFEYVNNSPDTLHFMYVHLWPNAYKNSKSALAMQLSAGGNEILTRASDSIIGFIDSLDFRVNNQQARWSFHDEHIDIAKVEFNSPLLPGEQCTVETPFKVKLPSGKISRLGHIGQSYQITQWYPKPAVYDAEGWHEMPYLNQGEFFSEFGSFDVSITLPENYVVGATGDLQTQSEIEFLDQKAEATEEKVANLDTMNVVDRRNKTPFPASSEKMKTIRYTQNNVHDFAWFADKRYDVLKGEVELPNSGRKVTSWAMFVPQNINLWQKAIEYINDGTYYYSKWNGDYPYNQVTAVDGTISAGGGMEYPTVTVIGNTGSAQGLETVIVHEVGHNWFYGILGSNERAHGWMDEGLNTLNEVRYFMTKYPDNEALADNIPLFDFHGLHYHDQNDLLYRTLQSTGLDQPIETHSACYSSTNYGIVMYQKTGLVFDYLRHYLGDERFDKAMQAYYTKFEFKHPQPEDFQKVLETTLNEKLDWVFEDLIKTTKRIEARLGRVKDLGDTFEVTVHNVGSVKGPIPVALMKGDEIIQLKWTKPGEKTTTLSMKGNGDQIMIDPLRVVPELSRQNNLWRKEGLIGKWEPLKLNLITSYNRPEKTNMHIIPLILGNSNDKLMLGIALHNYSIAPGRFNYFLAPMYSFGRNNASGIGNISYSFHQAKLNNGKIGLSLTSFKDESSLDDNRSFFAAASPYVRFDFSNKAKGYPFKHMVLLQGLAKQTRRASFYLREYGAFASWNTIWKKGRNQFSSNVRTDYIFNENTNESVGRVMGSATYSYDYMAARDWKGMIRIRSFLGYNFLFDVNNLGSEYRYGIPLNGMNGAQDAFVEEFFFNRSSTSHRANNRGGFYSGSDFGVADTWMQTNSLFFGIPTPQIILGQIGVFGNYGFFENNGTQYTPYALGVGYEIGDLFGLYYAIAQSDNLNSGYASSVFGQQIRITLNIDLFNSGLLQKVYQ
jgi:hypothetical protein